MDGGAGAGEDRNGRLELVIGGGFSRITSFFTMGVDVFISGGKEGGRNDCNFVISTAVRKEDK